MITMKKARNQLSLTQPELIKAVNISNLTQGMLSYYESNTRLMSDAEADVFLNALKTSEDVIIITREDLTWMIENKGGILKEFQLERMNGSDTEGH